MAGIERIDTDFIIIGSGAAGLRAALDLAEAGRVLILTKTELTESNSRYAQGGIAAAVGKSDSLELHLSDTLAAGCGLCDKEAVRLLAEEAPGEIQRLIDWGAAFDTVDGHLALGREGAHSAARVLHAHGDATGMEIVRTLSKRVRALPSVTVAPFSFVRDLIRIDGRIAGVDFVRDGKKFQATGTAVLIASGGAGQVYLETTNPSVATGDGFAIGYRAGAVLQDMEFVQFHPTALKLPGVPPFLISEAVRGEGAYLIDGGGHRFVDELAPRDVVARAIYSRTKSGSGVRLDLRHIRAADVRSRFPHIYSFCLDQGLDITANPLPVVPAAHYFMGGLVTDLEGRTSLPGLFAAGEAASTGVHGANRLASNSLLECVVFGKRAALAIRHDPRVRPPVTLPLPEARSVPAVAAAVRTAVQQTAWDCVGIERDAAGLERGLKNLIEIRTGWHSTTEPSVEELESVNLCAVAEMVLVAALRRLESRGAHYRTDYPGRNDPEFGFHSRIRIGKDLSAERS